MEWSGTNYFVDEGDGECYGDDVVRGGGVCKREVVGGGEGDEDADNAVGPKIHLHLVFEHETSTVDPFTLHG